LELNYKNQRLGDEKVFDWCKNEGLAKIKRMREGALECVDFSKNDIGDVSLQAILELIVSERRRVKRLMFFGNRLRDPSSLITLLQDSVCGLGSPGGPAELHLSDNRISQGAIEKLLECLAEFKELHGAGINPPFWIRAERNGLESVGDELARFGGERGLDIVLVTRQNRDRANRKADVHLYVQ